MMDRLADLLISGVESANTLFSAANTSQTIINRWMWGILLKYEGETIYHCNGRKYLCDPTHMVIIPKGCDYEWVCVQPGHFIYINFSSEMTGKDIIKVSLKNPDRILKAMKQLNYKLLNPKPFRKIEAIRDCYSILLEAAEQSQKASPHSLKVQKLAPAMEHIASHYTRIISNDELARLTGLSTVHFRKLFTEVYGTSPIAYAKELKMKMARQMLRSDHSSLTDVALSLGYSHIYDFSRDFKKHVGLSPSKYVETPDDEL